MPTPQQKRENPESAKEPRGSHQDNLAEGEEKDIEESLRNQEKKKQEPNR
jgi:hypothetical protein